MLASNDNKKRILKAGRLFFFLIGFSGLVLLILSFWIATEKVGGILCAGALIGHMLTWQIEIENKDVTKTGTLDHLP